MTEFKFDISNRQHLDCVHKGTFRRVGPCTVKNCEKDRCVEYICNRCDLETSDCESIESRCSIVAGFEYEFEKFEDEKAAAIYAEELKDVELVEPDPCPDHKGCYGECKL